MVLLRHGYYYLLCAHVVMITCSGGEAEEEEYSSGGSIKKQQYHKCVYVHLCNIILCVFEGRRRRLSLSSAALGVLFDSVLLIFDKLTLQPEGCAT